MARLTLEQTMNNLSLNKTASAGTVAPAATDLNFIDKLAASISEAANESTTQAAESATAAAAAASLAAHPELADGKTSVKVNPGPNGDAAALQAMMEIIGPNGAPLGADLVQENPVNAQGELPIVTDHDTVVKSPDEFNKDEAAAGMGLAEEAAKVAAATDSIEEGVDYICKHASAEYVPAIVEAMGEILDGNVEKNASEVDPNLVASAVEIIKNAGLTDKVLELAKQGADCSDTEICKLAEDILQTEQGLIANQQSIEKTAAEGAIFGQSMAKAFAETLKKTAAETETEEEKKEREKKEAEAKEKGKEGEEKMASAVNAVKGLIQLVKQGKLS
jgi:hypothetical protein